MAPRARLFILARAIEPTHEAGDTNAVGPHVVTHPDSKHLLREESRYELLGGSPQLLNCQLELGFDIWPVQDLDTENTPSEVDVNNDHALIWFEHERIVDLAFSGAKRRAEVVATPAATSELKLGNLLGERRHARRQEKGSKFRGERGEQLLNPHS